MTHSVSSDNSKMWLGLVAAVLQAARCAQPNRKPPCRDLVTAVLVSVHGLLLLHGALIAHALCYPEYLHSVIAVTCQPLMPLTCMRSPRTLGSHVALQCLTPLSMNSWLYPGLWSLDSGLQTPAC